MRTSNWLPPDRGRRWHSTVRIVLHVVAGLFVMTGCGSSGGDTPTLSVADSSTPHTSKPEPEKPKYNPFPEVEVKTSAGTFTLKLDAEKTPLTVSNFLYYVNHGLYDGTVFHEVYRDFIVLGGAFDATLTPRPAEMPIRNEAHNGLKNARGTIAMARPADAIDGATSQFFINLADNSSLDYVSEEPSQYGYCAFGEITSGMEVIDRIGQAEVRRTEQFESAAVEPIVIESMRRVK